MSKILFTHDNVSFTDEYNPKTKVHTIRRSEITGLDVKNSHYGIKRTNTKNIFAWDIFSANGNVIQTVWITIGTTNYEEKKVIANHILNLDNKTNNQN